MPLPIEKPWQRGWWSKAWCFAVMAVVLAFGSILWVIHLPQRLKERRQKPKPSTTDN